MVTLFILFAVLVVLLWFHFGILYHRSHFVVVSFAMLAMTIPLCPACCTISELSQHWACLAHKLACGTIPTRPVLTPLPTNSHLGVADGFSPSTKKAPHNNQHSYKKINILLQKKKNKSKKSKKRLLIIKII